MKIINFNKEQFQAEKIIKNKTDIVGQDLNGNEIFAFRGINDFTGFTVTNEDGTNSDFYIIEPTLAEKNRADIEYIAVMTGVDL